MGRVNRIVLVPREAREIRGGATVRRYGLARIGLSAHSALAEERLERVARLSRDGAGGPPPEAPGPGRSAP